MIYGIKKYRLRILWVSVSAFCLSLQQQSSAQTGGAITVFPHIKKQTITDWGYDIKQPGKAAALSNQLINSIFVQDGMMVLRIPVYARDGHPAEGVVTEAAYTTDNDIVGAIQRVKAIKPSVKLFASLRLEGTDTFLPWMKDGTGNVDSAQLAKVYRDFLVFMKSKGIIIDIFGVDNEPEFNQGGITPEKYKNIVGRIKAYAAEGLFTVPAQFVGAETYGPGNAATFVNTLTANGWGNTMDIAGTHYYPHLRPVAGAVNFCFEAGSKPKWNTEIHWDAKSDVDDQLEAEEGLISIFDCMDLGMTGLTWWNYGTGATNYRAQLNRALVQSTEGATVIDADDVDGRITISSSALNTRAFRKGNTITVWITNHRSAVIAGQEIKLMSGTVNGTPTFKQWINGSLITNGNASVINAVTTTLDIPAYSFTVVTINMNETIVPAFNPGNLLVIRSGFATHTLTAAAETVLLDEYTKAGVFVQSRQLPAGDFLLTGSSVTEGYANLSANGQFLAIAGYKTLPGEKNIAGTTASIVKRVIGVIDANGSADYTTQLTAAFDQNFVTGAVPSDDGNHLWVAGNGVNSTGGLYYAAKGSSNAVKINGTNFRVPAVYKNQLYISSNSGTLGSAVRLGSVGTGLPQTTATASNLTGADFGKDAGSGGVPVSMFQYVLLAMGKNSPDVLYVSSDGTTLPGIKKYLFEEGNWVYKFTIGDGVARYRGLTAVVTGADVELYATADGNKIMKAVDVNALTNNSMVPAATVLVNAPVNGLYKGISLVPSNGIITNTPFVEKVAKKLLVYPVPVADGSITIQHPAADKQTILMLMSIDGRILLSQTVKQGAMQSVINSAALQGGVYYISFRTKNLLLTQKIQKL